MKKTFLCTVVVLLFALLSARIASAGAILDGILKKGELVVGVSGDQPPLNATTKDGLIIGFDADLARAIATNLNVKISFSKMPFSELLAALQSGKVDMIVSGLTITPERNSRVVFVGPYHVSGKGLLVKRKNIDALKKEGLNSAKNKVTTLRGSTSQKIIEKLAPKATPFPAASYDDALELLYQDKVNMLIADYPYCAYIANRHHEKELTLWETKLSYEPLGVAIQEDTLFMNLLDNFIKTLIASGDINVLQDKWFLEREWIKQLP